MTLFNRRSHSLAFCLAVAFTACSEDEGSNKGPSGAIANRENGITFTDDASLPLCNDEREGYFVYVTATADFRTCTKGSWIAIDLRGAKGDQGEKGADGTSTDVTAAVGLYSKYKKSIFRATLSCSLQTNPTGTCIDKPAVTGSYGTAFLCGDKSVCTNGHVVSCPTCYEFQSFELQAVVGDSNSVNPDGKPDTAATPFVTLTSNSTITLHATRDLARLPISANPAGAVPMVLSVQDSTASVSPLRKILSMSYPLGFQDIYTDIGVVNAPHIGECKDDGAYPCLASYYDFSTSNNTDSGSSGSPLIDLDSGTVVGVTTGGTVKENANYTWAIDASKLTDID